MTRCRAAKQDNLEDQENIAKSSPASSPYRAQAFMDVVSPTGAVHTGQVRHRAAPVHQSDSALACSSAPHPSDPQPPTLTTKREKTDIPTLLSADILALRLQKHDADRMLWNVRRC